MTTISPEICFKLRDARRAAKIGQTELAVEVGCKQSAISMFEQGQPTKLNDEVVQKIAKKLGVDLSEKEKKKEEVARPLVERTSALPLVRGFCPNPRCPSNSSYMVDGRTFIKSDLLAADPVGGKFCALCGEVLEKCCPNCGAPVHAGAVCSFCGDPYIALCRTR